MTLNTVCCICRSKLDSISYPNVNLSLGKCGSCDVVYNEERNDIVEEDVEKFNNEFFDTYGVHENMFMTDISRMVSYGKRHSYSDRSVVDVGCGRGEFLRFCKTLGYEVFGVEKNQGLQKTMIQNKISAYSDIEKFKSDFKEVGYVYCSHALEHFIDPLDMLFQMKSLLKKGGVISVTIPCLNPMTFMLERILNHFKINSGWGIFMSVHLTYFNKKSLRLILEKAGFEDVEIYPGTLGENFIEKFFKNKSAIRYLYKLVLMPTLYFFSLFNLTPNLNAVARKP